MSKSRLRIAAALCAFFAILGVVYILVMVRDSKKGNAAEEQFSIQTTTIDGSYSESHLAEPVIEEYSDFSSTSIYDYTNGFTTRVYSYETTATERVTARPAPTLGSPEETTKTRTSDVVPHSTAASTQATTSVPTTVASTYEYAYAGFNPQPADTSVPFNELLVNRFYILPDDFKVDLAQVTGGQYLDKRVASDYNAMVAQAAKEGISLIPVSGYRSVQTQKENFNRKINYYMGLGYNKTVATQKASEIVLMPSTSEHNAGLAMDFGTNGNYTLDENFASTEAYRWLSNHASEYGFILRYPADKTNITKVTYEPWHWRYVGKDLAPKIKASGKVLEEYYNKVNY